MKHILGHTTNKDIIIMFIIMIIAGLLSTMNVFGFSFLALFKYVAR